MTDTDLTDKDPSWKGLVGIATAVLSPPAEIFARCWGSSEHNVAEGTHRPLRCSVVAFRETGDSTPALLAAADLLTMRNFSEIDQLRAKLLPLVGGDSPRVMVHFSHSHSVPSISDAYADMPGGDLIAEYRAQVAEKLLWCAQRALESAAPATASWGYGSCTLARNRNLTDPDSGETVVGYNPFAVADQTLLVGRIARGNNVIGTLINYACHPTSLGGRNRLISPDYPGAMREIVESQTGGAPCMFLHGASGDLAPRRQYSSDVGVADQNGRQLGFAALSVLEGLLPPESSLRFQGIEQSGTALARWELYPATPDTNLKCLEIKVPLTVADMPTEDSLVRALQTEPDRALSERLRRQLYRRRLVGNSQTYPLPVWVWRLGGAVVVGVPGEAHSLLQMALRERFPTLAIAVLNIVNGTHAYFPPSDDFTKHTYQTGISLFASGVLEALIESIGTVIASLVNR